MFNKSLGHDDLEELFQKYADVPSVNEFEFLMKPEYREGQKNGLLIRKFRRNYDEDATVDIAKITASILSEKQVNKDGDRAYSSYFEVSAPFKLASCDWTATAGAVPYATDFYGTNGFAVVNLALRATKDIKVTDSFSIPVFAEVMGNPCSQKAFLSFGFTLRP